MRSPFTRARVPLAILTAALVTAASVGGQTPGGGDDTARAIRELTSEVRALRTAVERTADNQVQGQILGMYLNVQQNRVTAAMTRLDTVQRELEAIVGRTRELAQASVATDTQLAQENDPARRRELENTQRAMKQESEQLAVQEQQARAREAEASQAQQTEEQRWTELIARLEQLLKK